MIKDDLNRWILRNWLFSSSTTTQEKGVVENNKMSLGCQKKKKGMLFMQQPQVARINNLQFYAMDHHSIGVILKRLQTDFKNSLRHVKPTYKNKDVEWSWVLLLLAHQILFQTLGWSSLYSPRKHLLKWKYQIRNMKSTPMSCQFSSEVRNF